MPTIPTPVLVLVSGAKTLHTPNVLACSSRRAAFGSTRTRNQLGRACLAGSKRVGLGASGAPKASWLIVTRTLCILIRTSYERDCGEGGIDEETVEVEEDGDARIGRSWFILWLCSQAVSSHILLFHLHCSPLMRNYIRFLHAGLPESSIFLLTRLCFYVIYSPSSHLSINSVPFLNHFYLAHHFSV